MSSQTAKDTRIGMRIPSNIKETIEKAAGLSGKSLSSYAISILLEHAQRDIREYETLTLGNQERDRFLDLIADPPKANDDLENLMCG